MASSLSGRVAIVFGAGSSGTALSNGRAAALAYARAGALVSAVDRDGAEAALTAKQIVRDGGVASSFTADITDEDAVSETIDAVAATLGAPTILHDNVGATITGSVTDLRREQWTCRWRSTWPSPSSTPHEEFE